MTVVAGPAKPGDSAEPADRHARIWRDIAASKQQAADAGFTLAQQDAVEAASKVLWDAGIELCAFRLIALDKLVRCEMDRQDQLEETEMLRASGEAR